MIKKDSANQTLDPFHFQTLTGKFTLQFSKIPCKSLRLIIGANQLAAITKRTILRTLSIMHDSIDLSNTLNKPLVSYHLFTLPQGILQGELGFHFLGPS